MQFKRDKRQNSNKIILDKYYTDTKLAKELIEKTYEVVGKDNITEVIEPSAGNGAFSRQIENCIAYDIFPEHSTIIKQDFLKLDLPYKKGRLFIGNPPFGNGYLPVKFYKQCIKFGDYVAFILPISQLNNNYRMYEFDLVYSEDLGGQYFTDRYIHVCFNIYKRPDNGRYNKRKNIKSKSIDIVEIRNQNKPIPNDFDLSICAWGSKMGQPFNSNHKRYARELYITIKNKDKKNEIIDFFNNFDWGVEFPMTSTPILRQWQIHSVIKRVFG